MFLYKILRSCQTCGECYSVCDPVWYHPCGNRCVFYNKIISPFKYFDIRKHPKYFCKYWSDGLKSNGKEFKI